MRPPDREEDTTGPTDSTPAALTSGSSLFQNSEGLECRHSRDSPCPCPVGGGGGGGGLLQIQH